MKRYTVRQVAKLLNLCQQRIATKVSQGHFPNACRCECGLSIMIPETDIPNATIDRRKKKNDGLRTKV